VGPDGYGVGMGTILFTVSLSSSIAVLLCCQYLQLWLLQVGVRSLYLARRMKKIRGATRGRKPSVKLTLQVARHTSNIPCCYLYLCSVKK